MKSYIYYMIYTLLFLIAFILSVVAFPKSGLIAMVFIGIGVYCLYQHIKITKKLFLKRNREDSSYGKKVIPSYSTLYDMDLSCWECSFFQRCYYNDFPATATSVNENPIENKISQGSPDKGIERSLHSSEIDRNNLKIRIREYAFDSCYEKNVYLALVRHLHNDNSISFHVHLNEVFDIINGDIHYYNPLWTTSFDFVLREKTRLDNLIAVVDVEYAVSNYNNPKTMDINEWKQKLCDDNKIPYLRISRAEAIKIRPYDDSTYPASLMMFIHRFR